MGPAIFKKQHGETLYSLRAIPVEGTVRWKARMRNQTMKTLLKTKRHGRTTQIGRASCRERV